MNIVVDILIAISAILLLYLGMIALLLLIAGALAGSEKGGSADGKKETKNAGRII